MIDQFWQRKTLICEIVEADSRRPFPFDRRNVANRVEEDLSRMGWVDTSNWGSEIESYVLQSIPEY